jgi:hypothetical protein
LRNLATLSDTWFNIVSASLPKTTFLALRLLLSLAGNLRPFFPRSS